MHQRQFQLGWSQLALLLGFTAALAISALAVDTFDAPYLTPRHKVGNQLVLHAYRTRPEREDVLLVGSSRFDAGFDPAIVERQLELETGRARFVYKVGLQGMRPWLLYQLVRDLVRERPPRDLLVLGIEARYFFDTIQGDQSSASGLHFLGSWRDLAAAAPWMLRSHERAAWRRIPFVGVQALWNLDWLLLDDTRLRCEHLQRTHGVRRIDREREDLVEALVARAHERAERGAVLAAESSARWRADAFTGLDMLGLERLLALLPTLPCDVVFVRPPVERTFDSRKQPDELRTFQQLVVPRLHAAGIDYTDLARAPYPIDRGDYRDRGSHLNLGGSYKASRALALDLLAPRLR